MASASRRARRKIKPINMTLETILADLNSATGKLDNYAQQVSAEDATPALIARLTQTIVLAGTATEILGGLVQSAKIAEMQAAAATDIDEDTDEASE